MHIYSGMMKDLSEEVRERLGRYRYRVFIETLGWSLNTESNIEIDQFDRLDTVYVIAQDTAGDIIGCSRLLPTTRPYLLKDIFPELLGQRKAPENRQVWELSRFSALNLNNSHTVYPVSKSKAANQLLKFTLHAARQLGARELITVSPKAMYRLAKKNGYRVSMGGPPKIVNGQSLCSCLIKTNGVAH